MKWLIGLSLTALAAVCGSGCSKSEAAADAVRVPDWRKIMSVEDDPAQPLVVFEGRSHNVSLGPGEAFNWHILGVASRTERKSNQRVQIMYNVKTVEAAHHLERAVAEISAGHDLLDIKDVIGPKRIGCIDPDALRTVACYQGIVIFTLDLDAYQQAMSKPVSVQIGTPPYERATIELPPEEIIALREGIKEYQAKYVK